MAAAVWPYVGSGSILLGDLLADLRERGGEGVVDATLGLLDGLRAVEAATLTTGPALTRRPGRSLLGLLEAEAEAMTLGVEGDDLELQRLALVDDVARMGDTLVRELADVDEALEAILDAHEGAEVDDLGDGAVDHVADLEVRDRRLPRIGQQAADREADATTLVVDVDDLGLDLVTDLVGALGVVDLVPGQLALVHEAVDAAEVDEDAERCDGANGALDLLAGLEAAEELVALLAALLVQRHLLREDEAVGLAVDLQDLEAQLAADVGLQLLGDLLGRVARLVVLRTAREVDDLADGHEAADAAVDDEAALVVVDDRGLDDDALVELLLHRAPLALEAGSTQREDGVAVGRLGLEHVDEDRVADVQLGLRLGVATVELAVADHALGLGADVDEHLVLVDAHDGALDDITVLEAGDVTRLLREELFHGRGLGTEVDRGRRLLCRSLRLWRCLGSGAAASASALRASGCGALPPRLGRGASPRRLRPLRVRLLGAAASAGRGLFGCGLCGGLSRRLGRGGLCGGLGRSPRPGRGLCRRPRRRASVGVSGAASAGASGAGVSASTAAAVSPDSGCSLGRGFDRRGLRGCGLGGVGRCLAPRVRGVLGVGGLRLFYGQLSGLLGR